MHRRVPVPGLRATARVVLSWTIERGTAKALTWPSGKASVVCREPAFTNRTSEWGRIRQENATLPRCPPQLHCRLAEVDPGMARRMKGNEGLAQRRSRRAWAAS